MIVGNQYRLCGNPMRCYMARGTPYGDFNSSAVNRRFSSASFQRFASKPSGCRPPHTWQQPRKSGGLSSHNNCSFSVAAAGSGAMAKGSICTCSITFTVTGIGGLIVPGVGSCSFSVSADGDLIGLFEMVGSSATTFTVTADLDATGLMDAAATFDIAADMISFALGHMVGTTEDTTALTPANIASAVWQYTLEGSLSAKDIERILLAINAGKTGIAGSTVTFRDQADLKDRVTGVMTGAKRTAVTLDPS